MGGLICALDGRKDNGDEDEDGEKQEPIKFTITTFR
jgi:hypothetical protein